MTVATTPDLVDRATRLFTFLTKAQQFKQKAVRDFSSYEEQGSVLWFSDLPERNEVRWHPDPEADHEPILSVERVLLPEAPRLPVELKGWVPGRWTDAWERPTLSAQRGSSGEMLDEHPNVQSLFDTWMSDWDRWAEQVRRDTPLWQAYGNLFKTYVQVTQKSEELELLLGVGLLVWKPESHDRIRRHLFTVPLTPRLDERSGRLEFFIDEAAVGLTSEFDMLGLDIIPEHHLVRETEELASDFPHQPLDIESLQGLAEPVAVRLHPQGRWDASLDVPESREHPVIAFAPALIVRPRNQAGLVRALSTIAEQIGERGEVPVGLLPLLDPDRLPPVTANTAAGALFEDGDEIIAPLPLNDVQRRILERVDTHAQTLVQGPPGTGKTHTAAALLTHLLAQGQRVLVTAHTDRALHEVRAKLPAAVRSLAVSVIGASRDDLADLRTAVDTIAKRAGEHDPTDADAGVDRALQEIEELKATRAQLQRAVIGAREQEVVIREHRGYSGSLARIAKDYQSDANRFSWLGELLEMQPGSASPLPNEEASEWLRLVRDESVVRDAAESQQRRPSSEDLPPATEFAEMVRTEGGLRAEVEQFDSLADGRAAQPLTTLTDDEITVLRDQLGNLDRRVEGLNHVVEPWAREALTAVLSGNGDVWRRRHAEILSGVAEVDDLLAGVPLGTRVELGSDPDRAVALAGAMAEYLATGVTLQTTADGTVKIRFFSPSVVKESRALFEEVRVDGRAPSTLDAVQRIVSHQAALRILGELETMWPSNVVAPDDNPREIVEWHRSRLTQLEQVLEIGDATRLEAERLREAAVEPPNWADSRARSHSILTMGAVLVDRSLRRVRAPLADLEAKLDRVVRWPDAAECARSLHDSVTRRDHVGYAAGLDRLHRMESVTELVARRDALTTALGEAAPRLVDEVQRQPDATHWDSRLGDLEGAFDWGSAGAWILEQDATDINAIQGQIMTVDQRLRDASVRIAALRAWNHAVGPDRLTPSRRADLRNYSQQVSRLGKGTGKYAAQQRMAIRRAMDRCRPAVPVWIMPIYRVAEQLAMEENAFDVVIVDEASQAGLEATLLQYLAPKIVVIGDNKQVSPSAVGIDQQQLRDLASQYLYDDRYKDTWQDPKRSLFDEAQMRYGGQLTLVEHRRSVPEIIGFSNRIAYEPEGIRLVPVRQFGADRLAPFVVRQVPTGTEEDRAGVNQTEARAIVDDLLACLADPDFEGLTMAVISLVGSTQAKYIESLLLNEVPAAVWDARDLRVGVAPDFQGSERDVVFLSMVSVAQPGRRMGALTQESYVQRFNVAVSRAKDQVRLFHSVQLDELTNRDDMRHKLLEYAYGVVGQDRLAPGASLAVAEDVSAEPFHSLFEQRVYNRIVERGFTVVPKSEQLGYVVDLVVVGASRKLAIACDGDEWSGPEAYEHDLARQRELERCGWEFFRVRESAFYVDPVATLSPLWDALDELGIQPSQPDGEPDWLDGEEGAESEELVDPYAWSSDIRAETDVAPRRGVLVDEEVEVDTLGIWEAPGEPQRVESDGYDFDGVRLLPYEEFSGETTPIAEASRAEILQGVLEVATVEGPLCWSRLRTAYVQASGGRRVGRNIAQQLDGVIRSAVRTGKLVSTGARIGGDDGRKTLRLPDQPKVVLRELGPRSLDEVPVEELRAAMAKSLSRHPEHGGDFEFIARRTLNLFGRTSLTSAARVRLEPVFDYCAQMNVGL